MSTGHLTSELQYVLAIFNWMLQKYCACHEKVEPRHTKSCNCHAKWSLQSNASVTWNLQPFHGLCVGGFKHRHHKARNHCACHAKRIVSDPLQIHHACQRFCNPHELLRLPRIFQAVEFPVPATQNAFSTSKNVPSPWCFNDFDFQIALARRRWRTTLTIEYLLETDQLSMLLLQSNLNTSLWPTTCPRQIGISFRHMPPTATRSAWLWRSWELWVCNRWVWAIMQTQCGYFALLLQNVSRSINHFPDGARLQVGIQQHWGYQRITSLDQVSSKP